MSRIFIPNNLSRAQLDAFRSIEAELNRLSNEKTVLTGSGAPTEVNNLQDGSIFYDFTNLNLYVFKLADSSWNDPTLASTNASNAIAANIYVSGTETINGAVIADGTVTVNELAANSITSQKLVVTGSNAITPATISADPAGSASAAQSNAATDATNKVAVVTNNIFTANTTTIDGAKITTGTVVANKLVLNQNILEVQGNQLSVVGAALSRRHNFFTTPPAAGSDYWTPGTTSTSVIPVPFGAAKIYVTGCGAGGGRPRVADNLVANIWRGASAGGGGGGAIDLPIDLPSNATHIRVIVGAGTAVAGVVGRPGTNSVRGGAGGASTVAWATSAAGTYTTLCTLYGGQGGAGANRSYVSSTINEPNFSLTSSGSGGGASPNLIGFSSAGENGQMCRVFNSNLEHNNNGGNAFISTFSRLGTIWPFGLAGGQTGNLGNPVTITLAISSNNGIGNPAHQFRGKGHGCGGNAWISKTNHGEEDAGGDGLVIIDFGS